MSTEAINIAICYKPVTHDKEDLCDADMNRKGLREIVENIWNIKALVDVLVEMGHIRL